MNKIQILLICVILISVIFIAGCTSNNTYKDDPFVGTWVSHYSDDRYMIIEVHSDGTSTTSALIDGKYFLNDESWNHISNNKYGVGITDPFYVTIASNGTTLISEDTPNIVFVKDDDYVIPTPPPTIINPTPTPTATPIHTATATPTPTVSVSDIQFTIKALEVIKGQTAADILLAENRFNDVPGDGQTAYLVKVQITLNSLGQYESKGYTLVTPSCDVILYTNGVGYDSESAVMPDQYPKAEQVRLTTGATMSGWLYFIVPTGRATIDMNGYHTTSNIVSL